MAIQLSYSQREVRKELLHRRETYFAIQKILSKPARDDEEDGNLECIHCHHRFNGVTAAAWKFGLCDDCLHHD
jgi:hypothetical protein